MNNPTNNPLDVVKGREQETGPFIGILVILLFLALGAFYFLKNELDMRSERPSVATSTEIVIYRRHIVGTSTPSTASSTANTELDAIQANLENETQGIDGLNF